MADGDPQAQLYNADGSKRWDIDTDSQASSVSSSWKARGNITPRAVGPDVSEDEAHRSRRIICGGEPPLPDVSPDIAQDWHDHLTRARIASSVIESTYICDGKPSSHVQGDPPPVSSGILHQHQIWASCSSRLQNHSVQISDSLFKWVYIWEVRNLTLNNITSEKWPIYQGRGRNVT